MNYLEMVKQCTVDYKKQIENIKDQKEKLKKQLDNEIIGQRFYSDQCHELDKNVNEVYENGKKEVDKINSSFKEFQRFKYGVKGNDVIPEDLELFRGDFEITQADADRLKEKYIKAKNYTMLNALKKYAKEKGLKVVYEVQEAEETFQFDLFSDYCKTAMIDNLIYENIEEMYQKVTAHFEELDKKGV